MKIKSFENFKKRCLERFGQNALCVELPDGGFGVRLHTPEKRTGAQSTTFPYPIEIVPDLGKTNRAAGDDADNTVVFSFSSETPVMNYWGEPEVLSHHPDDANMLRFAEVGACLYNHDSDRITGTPERVWIDGVKGYCEERFGSTEIAQQAKIEVLVDGSLRGISVGFIVREWVWLPNEETFYRGIPGTEDGVWVASKWEALEASHTPVPADPSVGVGRALKIPTPPVTDLESRKTEAEEKNEADRKRKIEIQLKEKQMLTDKQKLRAKALGLNPETTTQEQLVAAERNDAATQAGTKADERHAAEQARQTQIRAMANLQGSDDLADDAIKRNIGPGEFAIELAAKQRAGALPQPKDTLDKEERKDLPKFSFTRFLAGATAQLTGIGGKFDGLEREMAEEGIKECREAGLTPKGIVLPHKIMRHLSGLGQRTLTVGSAASAGNLVSTDLLSGNFVEALRNTTAVGNMGVTFLTGLIGNIEIPRQTNLLTGENLSEVEGSTAQDLETDIISLSPNRIGCEVEYSKQLLQQVGNPSVEAWNRNELFSALSLKMDYDALNGDGTSSSMLGLRNILTAISLGTNGSALDWGKIIALETSAATANALLGNLGYLTNAKVRGQLRTTLRAAAAGSQYIWEGTGEMSEVAGYRALASNQVLATTTTGGSLNTSDLFFGNWSDQIIAQWGGMDFVLDPFTKASNAVVRLIGNIWADTDVRHSSSFAYYSGVVTT